MRTVCLQIDLVNFKMNIILKKKNILAIRTKAAVVVEIAEAATSIMHDFMRLAVPISHKIIVSCT